MGRAVLDQSQCPFQFHSTVMMSHINQEGGKNKAKIDIHSHRPTCNLVMKRVFPPEGRKPGLLWTMSTVAKPRIGQIISEIGPGCARERQRMRGV